MLAGLGAPAPGARRRADRRRQHGPWRRGRGRGGPGRARRRRGVRPFTLATPAPRWPPGAGSCSPTPTACPRPTCSTGSPTPSPASAARSSPARPGARTTRRRCSPAGRGRGAARSPRISSTSARGPPGRRRTCSSAATAFEAVGGFCEVRSDADVELCWRIQERGWELEYRPGAVVAHRDPERLGDVLRQAAGYGAGRRWLRSSYGPAVPEPALARPLARAAGGALVWTLTLRLERAAFKLVDGAVAAASWWGYRFGDNRARRDLEHRRPGAHRRPGDRGDLDQVVEDEVGGQQRAAALAPARGPRRRAGTDRRARRGARASGWAARPRAGRGRRASGSASRRSRSESCGGAARRGGRRRSSASVQRAARRSLPSGPRSSTACHTSASGAKTGRAPASIARQARSQSSPPGWRPKVTVSKPPIRSSSSRR